MTDAPELCPCGQPLHYTDPTTERSVRAFVAELGPDVVIHIGDRRWHVSRHYIALHGLKAQDLIAGLVPGARAIADSDASDQARRYTHKRPGGNSGPEES